MAQYIGAVITQSHNRCLYHVLVLVLIIKYLFYWLSSSKFYWF